MVLPLLNIIAILEVKSKIKKATKNITFQCVLKFEYNINDTITPFLVGEAKLDR
jgi:hypothetical protein